MAREAYSKQKRQQVRDQIREQQAGPDIGRVPVYDANSIYLRLIEDIEELETEMAGLKARLAALEGKVP